MQRKGTWYWKNALFPLRLENKLYISTSGCRKKDGKKKGRLSVAGENTSRPGKSLEVKATIFNWYSY